MRAHAGAQAAVDVGYTSRDDVSHHGRLCGIELLVVEFDRWDAIGTPQRAGKVSVVVPACCSKPAPR